MERWIENIIVVAGSLVLVALASNMFGDPDITTIEFCTYTFIVFIWLELYDIKRKK